MAKHRRHQENACPTCGLATKWSEDYADDAWRHVESDSRWCTTDDAPVYPLNCGDRFRFKVRYYEQG